ncbi:MAG: hypothetical protein IPP12_22385 [Nitrospira sp.]|nr:hypothetical protein [Nitrospira sp.]
MMLRTAATRIELLQSQLAWTPVAQGLPTEPVNHERLKRRVAELEIKAAEVVAELRRQSDLVLFGDDTAGGEEERGKSNGLLFAAELVAEKFGI